mmetsp:Transcript_17712/g.41588  ORF Transcript_17712/g.41588 Transcript_17712/m.41588 type:complete len:233 (-) Transcript_17712:411-1109(-)
MWKDLVKSTDGIFANWGTIVDDPPHELCNQQVGALVGHRSQSFSCCSPRLGILGLQSSRHKPHHLFSVEANKADHRCKREAAHLRVCERAFPALQAGSHHDAVRGRAFCALLQHTQRLKGGLSHHEAGILAQIHEQTRRFQVTVRSQVTESIRCRRSHLPTSILRRIPCCITCSLVSAGCQTCKASERCESHLPVRVLYGPQALWMWLQQLCCSSFIVVVGMRTLDECLVMT